MLGAALCLLAAAFAVEAKLGWYSPNDNVRVQFGSIKSQPADAARYSIEALTLPASAPHSNGGLVLLLASPAVLLFNVIPGFAEIHPVAAPFSSFPSHFYRPPPHS